MFWFSRKVPCAGPAGNMPGCAAAGFPMSSGLPVLSPIVAPRCTVVAGCGAGTGAGRGVALCWAARGDWDRVVAAAEGVVMFALPLDSLGRICGCFGWMSRGGTRGARTGAGRNHLCDAGSRRRLCASALERVSAHPALVAALAAVPHIGEAEAENAVRQRLEGIGGDFMRLAGVVRDRVRCEQDGGTQLDALDGRCWRPVRRYLRLDDVTCAPSCP
ncbi:hypothetical protein MRX96_045079 [Rhipicephalus microplus]